MTAFTHPDFVNYQFEDSPTGCEIFMMDERWLPEYERAAVKMFSGGEYPTVGYISHIVVRSIDDESMEVSWYPNILDRFHELLIRLPRSAFVACVDTPRWDKRPRLFVRSSWLTSVHLRPYSAFALIDAIGVKRVMASDDQFSKKLVRLRDRIDEVAASNPGVAFVSFADSLLLKANWFVGQYDSEVRYSYEPEALLRLMPVLSRVFDDELGLRIYAAITQGTNEYEDTSLLHLSRHGNHVSLNSLGLPFAQLLAIDEAVRSAIREGRHLPADLYLDKQFFNSLRFGHTFKKEALTRGEYRAPLSSQPGQYVVADLRTVLDALDRRPPRASRK